MHGGFLYQHLYAARALLLAAAGGVLSVVVESDEDLELVEADRRTYVQVKMRGDGLGNADVRDALARFATYRALHRSGARAGRCAFVVATNAQPSPTLLTRSAGGDWPPDVRLDWPGAVPTAAALLPPPPPDLTALFAACCRLAAALPFAALAPETLIWKLAGAVMAASAGVAPWSDRSFDVDGLPALFEQLVVQLQDFPSPPAVYRAQEGEPDMASGAPVRLVVGLSGAGKTAWVAQAAAHLPTDAVYMDVRDTPGPSLTSALARDAAARLFSTGGELGRLLLPGASGKEVLLALDRRLSEEGRSALIVLDNVHAPPPEDTAAAVSGLRSIRFVLLAQPGPAASELAVRLLLRPEGLNGWSPDTVAAVAAEEGCGADPKACRRLLAVTGGLPLFVRNAMSLAAGEYGGDVGALCRDLDARMHSVQTAQELILSRLVDRLPDRARMTLGLLSACDVPLGRGELVEALRGAFGGDAAAYAADFRRLRGMGVLEIFGADRVKVHDALRLAGAAELDSLGPAARLAAFRALRTVLEASVRSDWSHAKVRLLMRVIGETGDAKTLVQLGGDENFHEMGFWPEIAESLDGLAQDPIQAPETRFWALDGLAFASARLGSADLPERLAAMRSLLETHDLGEDEALALGMKEMMAFAAAGRRNEARRALEATRALLPAEAIHARVFRYNAAIAGLRMGDAVPAAAEAEELVQEYYSLLGLSPLDVVGANPEALQAAVGGGEGVNDHCKHLADCLDLLARARNAAGADAVLARVHAMKFYQLAQAPESLIRVGQDLVDEFVGRRDYDGARVVFQDSLLPIMRELKLTGHVISVRAQHAVVLAYCRRFDDAEAEMSRLAAYEPALSDVERSTLANQRRLIARLRCDGPRPQWFEQPSGAPRRSADLQPRSRKVGRNQPCPCGSGAKFKRCCGR